jgi:hypothetical protein
LASDVVASASGRASFPFYKVSQRNSNITRQSYGRWGRREVGKGRRRAKRPNVRDLVVRNELLRDPICGQVKLSCKFKQNIVTHS